MGNWVFNDFASANSTSNLDLNAGNLPNFAKLVEKTGFTKANSGEQWYSDYFLEDASFFRMDDMNLGYTFDKIGSWKGSIRVAFGVQNCLRHHGLQRRGSRDPGRERHRRLDLAPSAHLLAASERQLLKTERKP